MEGAGLHTFAAAGAELFGNHINAFGVLFDGSGFTGFGAFAALYADHRFGLAVFLNDLDAGLAGIRDFIESGGAGIDTFQTSHTGDILLYFQFLHTKILLNCFLTHLFIHI